MDIGNFEMVTAIFFLVFISFCLLGMCYALHISFCQGTCDSNFCCNIGQNSPTDDSNAALDVLYIPAISKGSSEDTSPEKNSNSNDDYDTERENKKDCSRIFFISKERTIKIKADESNRSKADTLISI